MRVRSRWVQVRRIVASLLPLVEGELRLEGVAGGGGARSRGSCDASWKGVEGGGVGEQEVGFDVRSVARRGGE